MVGSRVWTNLIDLVSARRLGIMDWENLGLGFVHPLRRWDKEGERWLLAGY